MTIRIPVRLLLAVLYTAALLGGAFGISYLVFEWREDSDLADRVSSVESLAEEASEEVSDLERSSVIDEANRDNLTAINAATARRCHDALLEFDLLTIAGVSILDQQALDVLNKINREC